MARLCHVSGQRRRTLQTFKVPHAQWADLLSVRLLFLKLIFCILIFPGERRAVIIFFLINLAYMVSPSIPTDKQYLLVPGFAGFTNIMACRVFRFVALGMMEERPNTGLSSTKIAAAMQIDTLRVPAPGPILEVP